MPQYHLKDLTKLWFTQFLYQRSRTEKYSSKSLINQNIIN
jgi:hypothetical protein